MAEADTLFQRYPDLKRLRQSLQRTGEEFALFFVECNLPVLRNELAAALAQDITPQPVRIDLSLFSSDTQHLDELIALQVKGTQGPIFLFGLEQWLPTLSGDKLLSTVQQINWRRNRYAGLQRPLVIWLPRYAMDKLAESTPDFYDWYSGIFVFQASAELQIQEEGNSLETILSGDGIHAADRLSQKEKKHWMHTLHELLQGHTQEDAGRASLLGNLALLMNSMGDYDQALAKYQKALSIQQEIGDKKGEGVTLNNISQIHDARGDYETALDLLQQSLAIRREIGDKSGEGATLNNISQIHMARGDYDSAVDLLQQSLTICREIGNKEGEGATLNNMAINAHARGDYDTALDFLNQSLSIRREIGDKSGEGATLNNMSAIAHARGDYDTALNFQQQSLAIQKEIGDKKGEGTTLNNISQIHKASGDYTTALNFLQQSLAIRREIGDTAGLCATLFNMGHIHWQNTEPDKAMDRWIEAYQVAKRINLAQALNELKKLAGEIGLSGGLEGWEKLARQRDEQQNPP